jgi:tRNA threonylcarbamoyladenosine biosynthesis protein TsaE
MATYISHSPAETEALGESWGRAAQRGLVVGLSGDLGAGKTQLVKGLARGLGITARVSSPSFALVNVYPGGRLPLAHLDLYRLDTRDQIIGAGLEEYLEPEGVAVIEWAERWFEGIAEPIPMSNRQSAIATRLAPDTPHHASRVTHHALFRRVQIEALSETERRIIYEDSGP